LYTSVGGKQLANLGATFHSAVDKYSDTFTEWFPYGSEVHIKLVNTANLSSGSNAAQLGYVHVNGRPVTYTDGHSGNREYVEYKTKLTGPMVILYAWERALAEYGNVVGVPLTETVSYWTCNITV
jgi:hypothetical protein